MATFRGYGQFCPVAKAAEIVAERWTPLVVRELLAGSHRFSDLRRGVPLMSPSLLSQRLKELESVGVVERRLAPDGRNHEYHLTTAGQELEGVIGALGIWGRRWFHQSPSRRELDAGLLMWDIRRRVPGDHLPDHRVVIHFQIAGTPASRKYWWLILEPDAVDLCMVDPGFGTDLTLATDVRTLTEVWVGNARLEDALARSRITLSGPAEYRRRLPQWLGLNVFSAVPRVSVSRSPRARAS
jgi:DNA-binding HxlR family transcriptional regulator